MLLAGACCWRAADGGCLGRLQAGSGDCRGLIGSGSVGRRLATGRLQQLVGKGELLLANGDAVIDRGSLLAMSMAPDDSTSTVMA